MREKENRETEEQLTGMEGERGAVEEAEGYVHTYTGAAGSTIRTCIPISSQTPRPLPLYGDEIMPIVSSILRILGPGRDTQKPSSNACVAIRYIQMAPKYPPKYGCN